MKKIVLMLVAAMFFGVSTVEAQYSKMLEKQMKKEYKAKMKELSQGGWQVMGTSHSLEVALLKHYDALTQDDVYELEGVSTSSQKNIGTAKLQQDALEKYATSLSSSLKGRTVTEHGSALSEDDMIELDNFLQAFENKVQAEVNGDLKQSFTVFRETTLNGKKVYEFKGYFLVNKAKADADLLEAMKQQLAIAKMQMKQQALHNSAEKTIKFLEEAFEKEFAEAAQK